MSIIKNERGTYETYSVVNRKTGKVVYTSYNRIDCEQYIFAKEINYGGRYNG